MDFKSKIIPLNRKKLVHQNVTLTLLCSDIIAMAFSLIFAKETLMQIKKIDHNNYWGINNLYFHDLLFVFLCPFVLLYFYNRGHYTQRVPWWSQVQNILNTCAMAFVFDGFSRFALDISVSRLMIGLSWIYLFLLIIFARQIVYIFLRKQKIWEIPVVAIGDIDTIGNLLFAFHTDRYTGYNIKTVILRDQKYKTFNVNELPEKYRNLEIIKENINFSDYINQFPHKFFIIGLETFRGQERDNIVTALTSAKALFAILPSASRMNSYEMEPRYFFGHDIMLLHTRNTLFSPLGKTLKRTMDISISSVSLIFLAPIMLIISIFLKLEGQGGSVFYGGSRIGKDGHSFKCWKFRSMEPNSDHFLYDLLKRDQQAKSDWEQYRKLKQKDPRITTKTAHIIRKTSLDELPQLWNVLKGDMSLVGPRPILEDEIPLFGESIDEYLKVKPGITGLWQVSGRNDTTFQRRVYWDSWYVRNWSLWGDIVILIKTLSVVCGKKGAF